MVPCVTKPGCTRPRNPLLPRGCIPFEEIPESEVPTGLALLSPELLLLGSREAETYLLDIPLDGEAPDVLSKSSGCEMGGKAVL